MARGHLEAFAGELRIGPAKVPHKIDELAIMEAVCRTAGNAAGRSRVRGELESLKAGRARILQRWQTADDGGGDEVLEVHAEPRGFQIKSPIGGAQLDATFVAACGFRLQGAFVLGEREIEGCGF